MIKPKLIYNTMVGGGFTSKVVTRFGVTHIELRRSFAAQGAATQLLILVALDGYNFKGFETVDPQEAGERAWTREQNWKIKRGLPQGNKNMYAGPHLDHYATKGVQVRMSFNGPAKMTIQEFAGINAEVENAFAWLARRYELGEINQ